MTFAELFLTVTTVYATAGILAAIAFASRGVAVVDPAAKGAPLTFRLTVLPGAAALWPIVLARWLRASSRRAQP